MKHFGPILIAAGIAATVLPSLAALQSPADKSENLSRLKQLATGMSMYSMDWDDQFPAVQDTPSAFAVEFPYVKDMKVFKSLTPGSRFLFSMAIAGVNVEDIGNPSATIMFYDEKPCSDGRRAVAFADGHAKYAAPDEWAKVSLSLKKKFKKSGKPLPNNLWKQMWPHTPPPK